MLPDAERLPAFLRLPTLPTALAAHRMHPSPRAPAQGQLESCQQLLAADASLAGQCNTAGLLPVTLVVHGRHDDVAALLLREGVYDLSPPAPAERRGSFSGPLDLFVGPSFDDVADELLGALGEVGDGGHPLSAAIAAARPLSADQWALFPATCPALAWALPSVLERLPAKGRAPPPAHNAAVPAPHRAHV